MGVAVALAWSVVRPYTGRVVSEPVRGGFPDPSFSSLPGIEQARAWARVT